MNAKGYSVLVSPIGYKPNEEKRAIIRADRYAEDAAAQIGEIRVADENGEAKAAGHAKYWGAAWGVHWWIFDFAACREPGRYVLTASDIGFESDPFRIAEGLFSDETLYAASVGQLSAKEGGKAGWQDCGSDLRAVEGHAVQLLGLVDAYEAFRERRDDDFVASLMAQIRRGADYLTMCQREDGSYMNEYYVARDKTNWTLCMLANIALCRAYEVSGSIAYLDGAKLGWDYAVSIERFEERELLAEIADVRRLYGRYRPWKPPEGPRARDHLLLVWLGAELYKHTNDVRYKDEAVRSARLVAETFQNRDANANPAGLFGNFHAWPDSGIHQKSWEHIGWGFNCGAVLPDELAGLFSLLEQFPDDADRHLWRRIIRDYAYGYLKPVSELSPFGLYPLGMFDDEIRFFGPSWHGFNAVYGRIAGQAMRLARYFEDPAFEAIACRNMQWVAGLNAGIETDPGRYEAVSWINGIGRRYVRSWTDIAGSISNGFCANPQFKLHHLDDSEDRPAYVNTEDWIVHNGGWLSGLSQIERPFALKVKAQHRGRPVRAAVTLRMEDGHETEAAANHRGIARFGPLPSGVRGTVILAWEGAVIEVPVAAIAGLHRFVIADFADFLQADIRADRESRRCEIAVRNLGREAADISFSLHPDGIALERERLESRIEAGGSETFCVGYRLSGSRKVTLRSLAAEIESAYSYVYCEADWRDAE